MVQEGRFQGGSAPYGYRLAPSGIFNKSKHEVYKLEIDEDEARVVRMMFNLCVGSGYGRCRIANLSGNVFCGHCGGRLTLTTNGTVRKNADGVQVARRRIRCVCYNKTRHRAECDGQTGYTMHILDGMVTEVLHQIFDKMKAVREDEIVSRTQMNVTADVKNQLTASKREFAKATKEYEAVKLKLMAVIRGESSLPESLISEMAEDAKRQMMAASEKVSALFAPEQLAEVYRCIHEALESEYPINDVGGQEDHGKIFYERYPPPHASPAKRVAWGKEEQRSE